MARGTNQMIGQWVRHFGLGNSNGSYPAGLKLGSVGFWVQKLQNLLSYAGYQVDPREATTNQPSLAFGAKTDAAVKAFQTVNRIAATGVVDDQTWALLKLLPTNPDGYVTAQDKLDAQQVLAAGSAVPPIVTNPAVGKDLPPGTVPPSIVMGPATPLPTTPLTLVRPKAKSKLWEYGLYAGGALLVFALVTHKRS